MKCIRYSSSSSSMNSCSFYDDLAFVLYFRWCWMRSIFMYFFTGSFFFFCVFIGLEKLAYGWCQVVGSHFDLDHQSFCCFFLYVFWSLIIGWYCFLFDYQERNGLVDLWWVSSTVDGILSKWIEFLLSKRRRKLCIQQRIIIMNEWNWFLWIQLKGVCKPSSQIFNFMVDIT